MASTGPTDSIDDQAAAWAVEATHGVMTPESRADLQEWLAADRRHRGAYMRARAWLITAEEAVLAAQGGDQNAEPRARHPTMTMMAMRRTAAAIRQRTRQTGRCGAMPGNG